MQGEIYIDRESMQEGEREKEPIRRWGHWTRQQLMALHVETGVASSNVITLSFQPLMDVYCNYSLQDGGGPRIRTNTKQRMSLLSLLRLYT